jgi:hypothetical protein
MALGIVALDWVLRKHLDRRLRWTFLVVLVTASMFPKYVRGYEAEMFTVMCAAVGIAALSNERVRLGWTLLVIGVINIPATLVGLSFVALWYASITKRVRHLLPLAAAATFIMLESWVRRGGPLVSGYEGNASAPTVMPYSGLPGFSYPLFFGLLSILLSFGKGLLYYAPGLAVPVAERDVPNRLRTCYLMWMVYLAGLVLIYSKWWAWYGGWTWGPRFFLFASVPASLAIAVKLGQASRLRTTGLLSLFVVVALSVWVAIDGAVFEQRSMTRCLENDYAQEFLCWYTPEFSALWRPFVAPSTLSNAELGVVVYSVLAFAWLSAPLLTRMLALARQADFASTRAAIESMRF